MNCRPLVLALAALLPGAAFAQEHEHAHGATERLGHVTFPVSCNPEAGRRFERAMAVLHSFWWEEGSRAFDAVLAADSSCAMAHWGLAVTAWGNPFAGGPAGAPLQAAAAHADRAAAMGGKSPREAGFIAAVNALYRNAATTSNANRLQAYADTMARVFRDNPGDEEIAIYYALSQVATAPKTDTTFTNQKRAAAILNPLYAQHPDHPGLAHYIIHANDSPRLAYLGLEAARRYADIAPSVPHAQHMPSHIFIRLGLWDETIASNQKAFQAGVDYARAQGLGALPYEQFHALDYMVYGYLQQGRDSAARNTVTASQAYNPAHAPVAVIDGYNRIAMQLRLALERGDWQAAAALPLRGDSTALVTRALSHFARAIGAARSGGQAAADVQALDSIATLLAARNEPYWSRVIKIKADAARAWMAYAAGDKYQGGIMLAQSAADREDVTEKHPVTPGELLPARELLADMLLEDRRYPAARAAYLGTLLREPGRARSMFGAARAAELGGETALAQSGYREFLTLMAHADGDRPEVAAARKAVSGATGRSGM